MHTIHISGEIGWDVWPSDIRDELEKAGGDNVFVEISSPGGYVIDGIEIFNMLRSYSGHVETHIVGFAASMASYIAMAGDRVTTEDNGIFMIHNPWTFAIGDADDMRKEAEILEGMGDILAKAYMAQTGKTSEEIHKMMTDETWLFGQEIADEGFADEVTIAGDGATSKASALSFAKDKFSACVKHMQSAKSRGNDTAKLVAMIHDTGTHTPTDKDGVINNEEDIMDVNELKAKHPDLYNSVYQEGVKAEASRREKLEGWFENGEAAKAVAKQAIAEGKTQEDVMAQLISAMNSKSSEAVEVQLENVKDVSAVDEQDTKTGEGEDSIRAKIDDLKSRVKNVK